MPQRRMRLQPWAAFRLVSSLSSHIRFVRVEVSETFPACQLCRLTPWSPKSSAAPLRFKEDPATRRTPQRRGAIYDAGKTPDSYGSAKLILFQGSQLRLTNGQLGRVFLPPSTRPFNTRYAYLRRTSTKATRLTPLQASRRFPSALLHGYG